MSELVTHLSIVIFLLLTACIMRATQRRGRFVAYGRQRLERAAEARARRQVKQIVHDLHICELVAAAISVAQVAARWCLSCLGNATLALAIATVAFAETPPTAARAALADLQAQPIERRQLLRYLAFDRPEQVAAVDYVLNAISRSRLIVRAEPVGATLLRIDLAACGNPRDPAALAELHAAWETLVLIDPYFHLRTQVAIPTNLAAGLDQRSEKSARGAARHESTQPLDLEAVTIDGGWIPADVARDLKLSTLSAGPVLRADFFVAHAAAAPHYYAFAGVPRTESELLKRLGIDRVAVDRLAADTAANLFISRVTNKPRRLVRLPGPLGGTWFSRDVEVETPDRDPLRNPVNYIGAAAGRKRFGTTPRNGSPRRKTNSG